MKEEEWKGGEECREDVIRGKRDSAYLVKLFSLSFSSCASVAMDIYLEGFFLIIQSIMSAATGQKIASSCSQELGNI